MNKAEFLELLDNAIKSDSFERFSVSFYSADKDSVNSAMHAMREANQSGLFGISNATVSLELDRLITIEVKPRD